MAHDTANGKVYKGTIGEIMDQLGQDFVKVFEQNGIQASGINMLALTHILACQLRSGVEGTSDGKMPSFKTVLKVLSYGVSGKDWTPEDAAVLETEFKEILRSLGQQVSPEDLKEIADETLTEQSKEVTVH